MLLEQENDRKLLRHWQRLSDWQYARASIAMFIGTLLLGWALSLMHRHSSDQTVKLFYDLCESTGKDCDVVPNRH